MKTIWTIILTGAAVLAAGGANGNAGRTVDFPNSAVGPVYSFEISPEGDSTGNKLQSLSFKK
jgi:hypothetical protein